MQIELYIEGKKKTFTVPFVPMLAKRKYYEIQARIEEKNENPTTKEILEEDNEFYSILSDIVFKGQFTLEQLYEGADEKYLQKKMSEAIFGIKPKEDVEGNKEGE